MGSNSSDNQNTPPEKRPFFVSTSRLEDLQETPNIKKSWKLLGAQDITVSSQVNGRVWSILVEIGSEVIADQLIIDLKDHTQAYTLAAKRAASNLESAQINLEQTELSLDKAVTDTQLAVQQAQTQLNAADQQNQDSASALQLDQLEAELERARLDYETKLKNDQQTIMNFVATTKTATQDLITLYDDVIHEADTLLGVTPSYQNDNDVYEQSLGAQNKQTKSQATNQLRTVLATQDSLDTLDPSLTQEELLPRLSQLSTMTDLLIDLLQKIDKMLQNTSATSALPATLLSSFKSTIATLQSRTLGLSSSITQTKNSIESFLATYQQQQASLLQGIDILAQQFDLTERNLRDSQTQANIGLDSATTAYETSLKSKETTLKALRSAIQQAQISYQEAQTQLEKLQVTSPIDGTISEILVDEWQEVAPGSPLFRVSNNIQPEIEISLGSDELDLVEIWDSVQISTAEQRFTGQITSISKTASDNFTYQAVISLPEARQLLWVLVEVQIPVHKKDTLLMPINIIEVINTSAGVIRYLSGDSIEQKNVTLGKVWGDLVEVKNDLAEVTDLQIITNDVSNYDPVEFTLVEKNN